MTEFEKWVRSIMAKHRDSFTAGQAAWAEQLLEQEEFSLFAEDVCQFLMDKGLADAEDRAGIIYWAEKRHMGPLSPQIADQARMVAGAA